MTRGSSTVCRTRHRGSSASSSAMRWGLEVAGHAVRVADEAEARPERLADVHGRVAARPERAACDLAVEPRRRAGDGDHVVVAVEIRCRGEKQTGVWVPR